MALARDCSAARNLDGDLGCDTLQLQRERIDAIKVSITATQLIARGAATRGVMQATADPGRTVRQDDLERDVSRP